MLVYIDSNELIMELLQRLKYFETPFSNYYMALTEYETSLRTSSYLVQIMRNINNKALEECFLRLETHGLTLNIGKGKFLKHNLEFFWHDLFHWSVRPDPKKISAFVNTTTPSTVSEVRSLIGMANYSSQFIPNSATITEPLRSLTHKGVKFVWQPGHEEAYHKQKTTTINIPVILAYLRKLK